jgi:hypothetical protein
VSGHRTRSDVRPAWMEREDQLTASVVYSGAPGAWLGARIASGKQEPDRHPHTNYSQFLLWGRRVGLAARRGWPVRHPAAATGLHAADAYKASQGSITPKPRDGNPGMRNVLSKSLGTTAKSERVGQRDRDERSGRI